MLYYLVWAHLFFWVYNLCIIGQDLFKDFEDKLFTEKEYTRSWYSLLKNSTTFLFIVGLVVILLDYVGVF